MSFVGVDLQLRRRNTLRQTAQPKTGHSGRQEWVGACPLSCLRESLEGVDTGRRVNAS
jgi:hypothetical protein